LIFDLRILIGKKRNKVEVKKADLEFISDFE